MSGNADATRLSSEEKIELIRLLCKLNGSDMNNLGHYATMDLVAMDLGPQNSGKLRHDYVTGWYYSDGSCYPNQAWANANGWDY